MSRQFEQEVEFPQPGAVAAATAVDGALKCSANGVGVGSQRDTPVDLRVNGEEMAYDACLILIASWAGAAKNNIFHDRADPIIDAEASLDPSVEG